MPFKRVVQHAIVIGFLITTVAGLLFTVFRVRLLYVPWPLTYLSYSAMAPYQGRAETNRALAAEGRQTNGAWIEIDLSPYYPMSRGRQDVRMLEVGWWRMAIERRDAQEQRYRQKYMRLAQRLQALESDRGRQFDAVRLAWDEWPFSPFGHDALYASRQRTVFIEYP